MGAFSQKPWEDCPGGDFADYTAGGSWVYGTTVTLYANQYTGNTGEWVSLYGLPPIKNGNHQSGTPPEVQIGVNWEGYGPKQINTTPTEKMLPMFMQNCWEEFQMPEGDWYYSTWLCVNGGEHGAIITTAPPTHPEEGRIFKVVLDAFEYSSPYPATLSGYEWVENQEIQPESLGQIRSIFK